MAKIKITGIKGMNDMLPEDAGVWEKFEDAARSVAASYGYRQIRTPILEATGLFSRGVGEATDIVEKEMYSFTDSMNGEQLTLRPECTSAVCRCAIEHNITYNAPQRLWYFGPMFRHERPQRGRYRQFYQFGCEALGFAGPDVDIELLSLTARLWKNLGIKASLQLNSLGATEERARHREALVAYLKDNYDVLDEDARRRLETNPLRILDTKNPDMQAMVEAAPRLLDFLGEDSRRFLGTLEAGVQALGIDYTINPRLVRGLDYYNHTVFEGITDRLGAQGTICGGGRYDDLTGIFGMPNMSGVGISFGADRIYDVMTGLNLFPEEVSFTTRVFFTNLGAEEEAASLQLLRSLRDAGVAAEIYPECGKMKKQMEYANRRSIPYVVIIGSQELEAQAATVKDMRSGEQRQVPFAALAADLESRR